MTITYHSFTDNYLLSSFNTMMLGMIKAVEDEGPLLYQAGDPTLTWGYGYTFLRKNSGGKWERYGTLETDLGISQLGITFIEPAVMGWFR